jgi:WD40 repeat protein
MATRLLVTRRSAIVAAFVLLACSDGCDRREVIAAVGIDFSPDGERLVVASELLLILESSTGEDHTIGIPDQPFLKGIAYAPTGDFIATGSAAGQIILWSVDGNPIAEFNNGSGVHGVAISSDGTLVASADDENHVRLWRTRTGENLATFMSSAAQVAFSPDDRLLAAATDEGASVWRVEDGVKLGSRGIDGRGLAFAGNELLVSVGYDGLTTWDIGTGEERVLWDLGQPQEVAVSPDGKLAAIGLDGRMVQFREVADGRLVGSSYVPAPDVFSGMAFSPDGQRLAVTSWSARMSEIKVPSGEIIWTRDFFGYSP